jgi:hypothetical protein
VNVWMYYCVENPWKGLGENPLLTDDWEIVEPEITIFGLGWFKS